MSDFKKINEDLMAITEMAKAFSDRDTNTTLWVEDRSTHNNRYLKFYNVAKDPTHLATKVARIYIEKPEYVKSHKEHGIKEWILTEKEKRLFVKLLQSPYKRNPQITNWQQVICTFNDGFYDISPEDTIAGNIEQEDLDNGALTLDFPMPDYLKLPNKI